MSRMDMFNKAKLENIRFSTIHGLLTVDQIKLLPLYDADHPRKVGLKSILTLYKGIQDNPIITKTAKERIQLKIKILNKLIKDKK